MSFLTRVVAFGLFLLGGFTLGYVESMQPVIASVNKAAVSATAGNSNVASALVANVTTYIQQNVNPTMDTYLVIGIGLAAGGFIFLALGERKPKGGRDQVLPQSQPLPVKQQD